MLRSGQQGDAVKTLQELLKERGFDPGLADGVFGRQTLNALKAFQAAHLDPRGCPLVVDGKAGPLTMWALQHPTGEVPTDALAGYAEMPALSFGGTPLGRKALGVALSEMSAGAGEQGGNNCGPYVLKYLNDLAPEGSSWCAAFVSWCYREASKPGPTPLRYTVGAKDLFNQLKLKGLTYSLDQGNAPEPGDIVVWWRVKAQGWQGHAGLVHHSENGILYTIEGNRATNVRGFDYVLSRMEKLLGFARPKEN